LLKYLNTKGVAILIVMLVVLLVMVIMNILIYAATQERLATNSYDNSKESFYIAEAAANLAINRWVDFINDAHSSDTTKQVPEKVDITSTNNGYLKKYLDDGSTNSGNVRYDLERSFKDNLGTSNISISYSVDPSSVDNNGMLYDDDKYPSGPYNLLTINIQATYNGTMFPYKVNLKFCHHGKTLSYKGNATY